MEYLIVHLIAPLFGRYFFRLVRHFPSAFAAMAVAGECVGLWAIGLWPGQKFCGDWLLFVVGVVCLGFYSFLLMLLVVKLRNGTWAAFCDWAAKQV